MNSETDNANSNSNENAHIRIMQNNNCNYCSLDFGQKVLNKEHKAYEDYQATKTSLNDINEEMMIENDLMISLYKNDNNSKISGMTIHYYYYLIYYNQTFILKKFIYTLLNIFIN